MAVQTEPKTMSEAVLRPLDDKVNRNSKDSVFCDLFEDPQYLVQLYSALHPEDSAADIRDITIVTLENLMLRRQYNDLGFIVGNRLMVLVEAQSSWSENILWRFLLYLGDTYHRYIINNNLNQYGGKKLLLPKPELYVIYHNDRGDKPDSISLSKDIYNTEDPEEIFVDLKAKIIYNSRQGDILDQYITFCRVFDEQIRLHGQTREAVMETIRICRDRDVLRDYLAKEEVADIMVTIFDKERAMQLEMQDVRDEAREENQLTSIQSLMKTLKLTAQQAMDALQIPLSDQKKFLTML